MTTFQDRIKEPLARVDPRSAGNGPAAPFDQVLEEFVQTLVAEEPSVGAAIEKGHQPQMRSLVTWPRYRRDERAIMLTFWLHGTTMKVLNEKELAPFESPEAVRDYLVDFLENSAFPLILAEYETRCNEDLDGFLRTTSLREASPKDAMVVVSAADQKTIATAPAGTTINLHVEPQRVPGTAEYDASRKYAYLLSGGYGLRLIRHGLAGGKVHLSGEVMAPTETT